MPASQILSGEQKMLVENHIHSMVPLFSMRPENDPSHAQATLIAVSKMQLSLAGKESGELAAEARGEAYMAALEDVPCWAVQEAARKWYRGQCGDGHDYRWMPAPFILRNIAQNEELRVSATVRKLRDLIAAEPLIEFSKDHMDKMRERVAEHNPKLKRA